ncbi:MAG: ABC transporter ATP-binding protein [Treponema sp.]|jgi:iron complex transport system ATP-binding protein|nr:ABC transporter ATP-binding protein [Treponema sp.]
MGIEVTKLRFAYLNRPVLRDISLSLGSGEFLGFLGPNGSGKSTFLKNLLGFLKPSGGRIVFSGELSSSPEFSRAERARRLAFVPQRPGIQSSLSVRDLILMGRLPHLKDRWAGYGGGDHQMVEEVLRVLGMEDMADRDVMSLSGGELQKAIIGRCLVQEGDIILLDEATSGLDLNHTIEIMELMRRKADREAKTIVAVLHDLNLAAQYCDRIVLLKDGKLRYQGLPSAILTESVVEEIYGVRAAVKIDQEDGRPYVLPRRIRREGDSGVS